VQIGGQSGIVANRDIDIAENEIDGIDAPQADRLEARGQRRESLRSGASSASLICPMVSGET